jgi:hypothetical protein
MIILFAIELNAAHTIHRAKRQLSIIRDSSPAVLIGKIHLVDMNSSARFRVEGIRIAVAGALQ